MNKKIEDLIYEIRGKQVMLDSDLASLYKCANGIKTINQVVKRNIERFPDDFQEMDIVGLAFKISDYFIVNIKIANHWLEI